MRNGGHVTEQLQLTRDKMFMGQHQLQFDHRHFGTHFELYQYSPEEDWWGDPRNGPWSDAQVASDIIGSEVAVENPEAIAAQVARLFLGRQEGTRVHFGDRSVNFVPSMGAWRGLTALDLKSRQPSRVGDWARIGGVKFRFV